MNKFHQHYEHTDLSFHSFRTIVVFPRILQILLRLQGTQASILHRVIDGRRSCYDLRHNVARRACFIPVSIQRQ